MLVNRALIWFNVFQKFNIFKMNRITHFLSLILLVLCSTTLVAQTTYIWNATGGGDFGTAGNWTPARNTPSATDILQFNDGNTYTVTGVPTQTIRQLFVTGNTNVSLQSSMAATLNINGPTLTNNLVIENGSTLQLSSTFNFSTDLRFLTTASQRGDISGTFIINSNIPFTNSFTTNNIASTIVTVSNTGLIVNNGGVINSSAATLVFAAGSNYNHAMDGGVIPTATWNTTSTCTISGIVNSNIASGLTGTFGNLVWNCPSQNTAQGYISGALTVNGNLTVTAGTFSASSFVITGNATNTLSVANGATLEIGNGGASTNTFPSNFTNANITLASGSNVVYNSTSAQNVSGVPTYSNLFIRGTGTRTLAANATVDGNLTIEANAIFNTGVNQIIGNATGNFTMAAGSSMQIGAGTAVYPQFPTNFITANISLHPTSTVNYSTITGTQIVAGVVSGVGPATYGNLTITGGTGTKQLTGNTTVAGVFTISGANTFNDGGFTLSVNGNIANGGTHTGTGSISLTGGNAVHIFTGTGSFTNLILNDPLGASMNANFSINGLLTLTNGNFFINAQTLTLSGTFAATGGGLAGSTSSNLSITGAGALGTLVFASGFENLSSLSINKTGPGSVNLGSNLNLWANGTGLTLTNGRLILESFNLTLSNVTTLTGGSVNAMVVPESSGELRKTFTTTITFTYPVGDLTGTAEYSPVTLTSFTSDITRTIGVKLTNAAHPNDGGSANRANRYWEFSDNQAGLGSYTYTGTFTNLAADLVGTYASMSVGIWDGASWSHLTNVIGTPGMGIGAQSQNTARLGGRAFMGRTASPTGTTYTWLPTSGSHDFNLPSNWSPVRNTPFTTDILQFNSTGTSTAINVPTQTVTRIIVDNNTNITFQSNATSTLTINGPTATTNLSVTAGSTLQVSNDVSTTTLTLNFGAVTGQLGNVAGTIRVNLNGTFTTTAANPVTFASGGEYHHNINGGTMPAGAVWNSNSTLRFTGTTTTGPVGFAGTYGHVIVNCTPSQTSPIAISNPTQIAGNLTVTSGIFSFNSFSLSVAGNVVNNASIFTAGALTMNGTSAQTISGTGIWLNGALTAAMPTFIVNNSAGVALNCSFSVLNSLQLISGVLSGTGTLTLGSGEASTLTTTITGGSISPSLNMAYNLFNVTYNLTYNNASVMNTSGEFPPISITPPIGGTVTIGNASTIVLTNDVVAFGVSISNVTNSILRLNGRTLKVLGAFNNTATTANTMGLDASVANSKLWFAGNAAFNIALGNQIFSSIITAPDIEISNTFSGNGASGGHILNSTGTVKNILVNTGCFFQIGNFTLNVTGNITNNGTIMANGGNTGATLNFNGTVAQTVSGTGQTILYTTNPGPGFPAIIVNNTSGATPALSLNQNLTIQNTFTLLTGSIGGTGTLTLGNAGVGSTLTVAIGNGSTPGGLILPALTVNHNLSNMTFNVNYNILSPAAGYTTGKELPGLSAVFPVAGTVVIANTHASGVTLGDDAKVFGFTINSGTTFHMNGKTLALAGGFANNSAVANTGLNSSVAGSKIHFMGNIVQDINLGGNQTFGGVLTTPDLEISNTFYNASLTSGARVTSVCAARNVTVNPNSYFQVGNVNFSITGNFTNNGFTYSSGANTSAMITMAGTALQTIGGSGTWNQIITNPMANTFPGFGINNTSGLTPAVNLNQNIALQNALNLHAGNLSGTGTLTLGNAVAGNTFTMAVGSGTSAGGTINNALNVNYNLANTTFNTTYNILSPAAGYTTGKELPNLAAALPSGGTITISNNHASGVTLGLDATGFSFTISSGTIFHLNGKTLRLGGNFTNSAAAANTGLNSSVSGSKIWMVGGVFQSISLGNQTFAGVTHGPNIESSNTFYNATTTSGANLASAGVVNNIQINSGSYLQHGFGGNIQVTGNITNNGTLFINGANTTATFVFTNQTIPQTISGSGNWRQIVTNSGVGRFTGFLIQNPNGVILNQNIALQNRLDLLTAGGVLSGSGILTLGVGTTSTLLVNRSFGSINMTNPVQYNLSGVTYNVDYSLTAAATPITTGAELPPLSYVDYKLGTVTNNNTIANGGVILGSSSSINSINNVAGNFFNLNDNTLNIFGTYTNNGTLNGSAANSRLGFVGLIAQSITFGTLTSSFLSNATVNNPAGVTFNNTIQIGSAGSNGNLNIALGSLTQASGTTLTVFGTFSGSGTLISSAANASLSLQGSAGNMGTINLNNNAQTFPNFTMNVTGANPQVTINGNMNIGTSFTLTSGVVKMGNNTVNYTNTVTTPMLIANQNSSSYFEFNGASSGLSWSMSGVGAGTYRWPIGITGVSTWRPVTMQTLATAGANSSAKIGYFGTISGAGYSAQDIASGDIRSNYIANLTTAGNLGTPNITMEYQDSDFNTVPTSASDVKIYYYNMPPGAGTSQWTSTGTQTSNGTNGSNITIVKDGAINLTTGGLYPLNLAETNNDPGSATNTFVWTGTTNTSWIGALNNWNPLPASAADYPGMGVNTNVNVIIPQVTNQPTATGLTLALKDVTIGNGATLTLATSTTMTLSGSLYNNAVNATNWGLIGTGTSTVVYNGTSQLIGPGNYMNLNFSGATTPVLSPVSSINVAGSFTPVNSGVTSTGSTIWFYGATQTIPSFNFFNNVIFGSAGTSHTLSGQITVAGDMTINTTTFADGGNQIIGPGTGSGTMTILAPSPRNYNGSYAGAKALPDFQNYNIWGNQTNIVQFNFSGANAAVQTLPSATYGHITLSSGGLNKKTSGGSLTVRGNLTLNSGSFDDGGHTVSIFGNIISAVSVGGTSSGFTSTGSGKFLLTGGISAHSISATVSPAHLGNLELNDGFGATITSTGIWQLNGDLTINSGTFNIASNTTNFTAIGTTTIAAGATLNHSATGGIRNFGNVINNGTWNETIAPSIYFNGDYENNGDFNSNSGIHYFAGVNKEIRGNNFLSIQQVAITGTYTNKIIGSYDLINGGPNFVATGGFRITNSWFAGTGTLTQFTNSLLVINPNAVMPASLVASANGNTVVYNNGTATTIKVPVGGNFHNLILNPTAAITYTLGGATTIDNNLTYYPSIANSVFADGGFLLTGPGASSGTLNMSSPFTNSLTLTNTSLTPVSPFPSFGTYNIGVTNTVNYNASVAQDIAASAVTGVTFGNLNIIGAGIKTARQNITVAGTLTTSGGGLADNGNTITVNGDLAGTAAHTSTGSGKIVLSGGLQPHTISRSGALGNIELDDNQGALITGAFTINGNLALKNGVMYLGNSITTTLAGTTTYPAPGGFLGGNAITNSTSNLSITGTGTLGELRFTPNYSNIGNLTLNRTVTGLVNLGTDVMVNTSLTLTNGRLNLGNFNFYFNTGATVGGAPSNANHIIADAALGTGRVYKYYSPASATSFTFPVGDNTVTAEYTPLTLTSFTPIGGVRAIGVRLTDDDHPQNITGQPNRISRFWNFGDIPGTSTGYNYTSMTLNYITGAPDNVGTLNTTNCQLNLYSNVSNSWIGALNVTGTVTATQAVATAPVFFTQGSSPFNNSDVTLRLNTATSYTWLPTSGSQDWNVASNWAPPRNNPGVNDTLIFSQGGTSVAINVPTQTIRHILVTGNTNVSLQAATTNTLTIAGTAATNSLIVNGGSTLQIGTSVQGIMTLAFATPAGQLAAINGTLRVNNNALYQTTNVVTTFGAGSAYIHNRDGGTIPNGAAAVTWNPTSTCRISGCVLTNPTGLATAMTYGNFIYDSPGTSAAFGAGMIFKGNLEVQSGLFNTGAATHNLEGNLINNGIVSSNGTLIIFNGTSPQTISGTGQWTTTANAIDNAFGGMTINNAAGVAMNVNFALRSTLNLTLGTLSGSGTLTFGIGSPVTLTTVVTNGVISPTLNAAYNLNNVTYNLTYNNSTAPYTTGKELPPISATPPLAGTMVINNNQGLTLSANSVFFGLTINFLTGNILHLNGNTIRLHGAYANNATTVNTMGMNASVAGSKLEFNGNVQQNIVFGNQTFSSVLTAPDMDINNTSFNVSGASSATISNNGTVKNLTVNPNSHLQINSFTLTVMGDLVNNGQIFANGANTGAAVMMAGTALQTISGSGAWNQIGTNAGPNRFPGFIMNNTSGADPAVNLNQSFALQSNLTLTAGILKGSGTLTLGINTLNTILTGTVTNGSIPVGGLNVNYDLANITYNLTYNSSTSAYTTGCELPINTAIAPLAGNLIINNLQSVSLGRNSCFFNATINFATGIILNLNGYTLRLTGNFTNNATTVNTMGLNSSVAGSKLLFESAAAQTITMGNQTFGGVPIGPDLEINNSNAASGASVTSGNTYFNNVIVNTNRFLQFNSNTTHFIAGNVTNNGTIFCPGANVITALNFNGTTAQTISGSGTWSLIGTNQGTNRFTTFTINNTSGSSPAVILNQNVALQNALNLFSGELGGSGTLTYGLGTGAFQMTRTAGSMAGSYNPNFSGLVGIIFNANYGNSAAPLSITTGNELPYAPAHTQTINNLTCNFNAAGGAVTLSNHVSLGNNGTLSITNTRLTLGTFDLTVNNPASGAITGGAYGINNMIIADGTGRIRKAFAVGATAAVTFPLGDNSGGAGNNPGADYSPVSLTINSNSSLRYFSINLVDAQHPNDVTVNNYISRYWNISDNLNGAGSYTYNATFTYSTLATSDLVGTQTLASANFWNGTMWSAVTSTYPVNGFTISGQNQLTAPLGLASPIAYTGRVNPPQTYTWIPTTGSHDWNDPLKWNPNRYSPQVNDVLKFSNGGTSIALNVPTQTIGRLIVDNSTAGMNPPTNVSFVSSTGGTSTLTINGTTALENIVVDTAATLQLSSGGTSNLNLTMTTTASQLGRISGTLTLNPNSVNNNTFTSNGIASNVFNVTPTGVLQNNGGTVTSTVATLKFGNGATYNHNRDGGTIPTAEWYNAVGPVISNVNVVGCVSTAPTGHGQTFGNYTWNGTSAQVAGTTNLAMSGTVIQGNFTIVSTGTGSIILSNNAAGSITIGGDWIIQGGDIAYNNTGGSVTIVNLAGNFNQTGGTLQRGTSVGTTNTLNFNNAAVNRTYTNAGTFNTTGINVNVNLNAIVTLNNPITINQAMTNSGTLFMQGNIIDGSGTFTLTSATTATLGIGHAEGITTSGNALGNVQVGGARTYGTLANYVYNGGAAQVTGNGLTTCNNLTINNAFGVTQQNPTNTTHNVIVTNQLTLSSGQYQIGGLSGNLNTLTLNGPAISGTGTNLASNQFSNLTFGGAAAGVFIPSSIANLNALTCGNTNAAGVTLNGDLNLHQSTAGVLALSANSRLFLGANNLTILSNAYTATVSGTFSANCMVVADGIGRLRKNFGTTGFAAFTFPVGDNSGGVGNNPGFDYSPFTVTFTANSQDRIIGVRVIDAVHPDNGPSVDFASRYWSVTDSEFGNGTYSYLPLTLTYSTTPTSDVNGTVANFRVNRWDGAFWNEVPSTVGAPNVSTNVARDETNGPLNGDYKIRKDPPCTEPTVQASGPVLGTSTSTTQELSWTNGDGTGGVIVLLRQGSPVSGAPISNNAYTANSTFGLGSQIGTGNFVVYQGNAGTTTIIGLLTNTTYHYAIHSYNLVGPCYMPTPLTGSFTTADGPMALLSSTTEQITGLLPLESTNQPIVRLRIVTDNGTNPPLTVNDIVFNTTGTTNVSDITNAKIFYTGSSTTFSATTQFGSAVAVPNGSHTVNGSQVLSSGNNYFWITNDIPVTATLGNFVDAECTSFNIGSNETPAITAPTGNRMISSPNLMSCGYTYSNTPAPTWSSISGLGGTTVVASGLGIDDQHYPNISLPSGFTFEFNGAIYNSIGINANGFIWFGPYNPPAGNVYNPISTTLPYYGVISALGADLQAHDYATNTPQILYNVSGTAPSRVFTIEWRAFKAWLNFSWACDFLGYFDWNRYDFQIKLYENGGANSNVVDIIHKDQTPVCISDNGLSAQVGMRGSVNSDFVNRVRTGTTNNTNTTAGTLNNQTITHGVSQYFSSNTRMRYTPTLTTPVVTPSPTATNTCPASTVSLSSTSTAPSHQWYMDNAAISGATTTSHTASASGQYVLKASSGACARYSNPAVNVTINSCFPIWVGGTSGVETDWFTNTNWSNNQVPTAADSAVIPDRPYFPFITNSQNPAVKYITFETNGEMTVDMMGVVTISNNGGLHNISGNTVNLGDGTIEFTNNGLITGSDSLRIGKLDLYGPVNIQKTPFINNALIRRSAASGINNPVVYGNTSILMYETANTVSVGSEWTGANISAGLGTPQNLEMYSGVILQMPLGDRGVAGNISILNGNLTLNPTSGSLFVGGNWLRTGTGAAFTHNNKKVVFSGTANSTITNDVQSGSAENFYDLEINKTGAAKLILSTGTKYLNIQNQLMLAAGRIDLEQNKLKLGTHGNNGSITGGGPGSYVISDNDSAEIIRQTTTATSYYFPLGDETNYTPATVTLTNASNVSDSSGLRVALVPAMHPALSTSSNYIARYFTVEPIQFNGNPQYSILYKYVDSDVVNGPETDLVPVKHGSQSGWIAASGYGAQAEMGSGSIDFSGNEISWSGLTSFSSFTGTGLGTTPLPVSLVEFNATAIDNAQVLCEWTTATETNNDYFTVERSPNTYNFEEVGIVDGAGNSNQLLQYTFLDERPLDGWSYYRLKQTDYNGAFSYSELRAVYIGAKESTLVYFDQASNLQINAAMPDDVTCEISLLDLHGKKVINVNKQTVKGLNSWTINTQNLSVGMYILNLRTEFSNQSIKLIKTR